jgi:hypothetical protein
MKAILLLYVILFDSFGRTQVFESINANPDTCSNYLKTELQKELTKNRTINIVFHSHNVPAGFFNTPNVNTISAYLKLFLRKLKEIYPYAVLTISVIAIGWENSVGGATGFESDLLTYKPDLNFIDYTLSDRVVGLEKAKKDINDDIFPK